MEEKSQKRVWGLFVGDNGDQLEVFNSQAGPFPPETGSCGRVAIGWPAIGDLTLYENNYLDYVEKFRKVYPDDSERLFKTRANMPWKFAFTMNIGDWVICPSSAAGLLLVGVVVGEYKSDFDDETKLYGRRRPDFVHTRTVRWKYIVNQSDPRYSKLNRIGQLTLSQQDMTEEYLLDVLGKQTEPGA
jgi:restriction system protein